MTALALVVCLLASPAAPASQPTETWIKGRIERVGTVYTPALNLISEEGKRYEVIGDLSGELTGLEQAKIEVLVARERDGWQLPRVRALNYRILDIGGGDKPEIGIVRVDGEQVSVLVEPKKTLVLADTALAKRLKTRAGEKVWVVGKPVSNNMFKIWRVGYLGVPKTASASQPASQATGAQEKE